MQVRRITPSETFDLRLQVLRPHHPLMDAMFSGDDMPEAGHFGVFEEDRIVAVGTVYPEIYVGGCDGVTENDPMRAVGAWRLRGMATAPEFRGQGCGALVLKACLEHAWKAGASVVWCNARTRASNFYERHGFEKMSEEYEMPGIGPHFLMRVNQRSAQR